MRDLEVEHRRVAPGVEYVVAFAEVPSLATLLLSVVRKPMLNGNSLAKLVTALWFRYLATQLVLEWLISKDVEGPSAV